LARIVIVGGAGAFGSKLAERLALSDTADLVIAGRSLERASVAASRLRDASSLSITGAQVDAECITVPELSALSPDVVINASGPFQEQNYHLAETAITAGCHYIDLADARDYVTGIVALDARAKAAGVTVISGASSVPGLSSSVVADVARDFAELHQVSIAISPGNHFDPGEATTRSVLSGLGKPIEIWTNGQWQTRYGWQDVRRVPIQGLGKRWLGNVDVPDLTLFPQHFPDVKTVRFQAGVEVPFQHLGLWSLSWLVRAGAVRRPERLTSILLPLKRALGWFGSDAGGMTVDVTGTDRAGAAVKATWTLVARSGHGPYVPVLASVVLAQDLLSGRMNRCGAMPCFNLFAPAQFKAVAAGLDIAFDITQTHGNA
jgi:Saccharopine dehydrogenase NADP binding domain